MVEEEIKAGRALDTFIAEKFMGWKQGGPRVGWRRPPLNPFMHYDEVPYYSSSPRATQELVDKLFEMGEMLAICNAALEVIERKARGE